MRFLIVDDERTVHEQLTSLIPWDQLGWQIVGHAYDGEEARRLAEQLMPNIIVTDIRMPMMDGLGLLEWLQQSNHPAKVIVLSGYGDFNYTRTAFKRDAYDYLLKPIKEAELLSVLGRAVDELRQEHQSQSDRINEKAVLNQGLVLMHDELFMQAAVTGQLDENELHVRAEQLMIALPEGRYTTIVVKILEADEHIQQRYGGDRHTFLFAARNIIQETVGKQTLVFRNLQKAAEFVVLLSHQERPIDWLPSDLDKLRSSAERYLRVRLRIGASAPKQRISKLATAYAEAVSALESMRIGGDEAIAIYGQATSVAANQVKPVESWQEVNMLLDMFLGTGALREEALLLDKLNEAFSTAMLAKMSATEWKKAATELLAKLEFAGGHDEAELQQLNEARSGIQEVRTEQARQAISTLLQDRLTKASSVTRMKNGRQLMEVVKQYIDLNYRDVTLDDIAQKFYMNKNYFCSLFKNATGESFVEYLTALRMEHSKRLLKQSELKTYEVADYVGYSDQRYFSQVFRKHTGMKPTEYRQFARQQAE